MVMVNPFDNAMFETSSLTLAINKLPEQPGILGEMGLFTQKPISTLSAMIEEKLGKLSLVQSNVRGTRVRETPHVKRITRSLTVPHFPEFDEVLADSVQGIRAFGEESSLMQLAEVVNDRLQTMKNNLDATREWQRIAAVQGMVYDADGSTIYNLFTEFNIAQQTATADFSKTSPAVDFKTTCTQIRRLIEHAAGGSRFTSLLGICGDNFYDAMGEAKSVKETFLNWSDAVGLRDSNATRPNFPFGGIKWMNYSTKIGSTYYCPTDYAFVIPMGMPDLFVEFLAPANYAETVNQLGKPYYAKQERMRFDKGTELEAQANMLNICSRPGIPVKVAFTT